MLPFILRRTVAALVTLIALSLVTYFLIYLAPGDPVTIMVAQRMGRFPTETQVEALRQELGLDKPIPMQYLEWLGRALRGDFGYSVRTQESVTYELGLRLGPTLLLVSTALLIALVIGLPLGMMAASREGSWFDTLVRSSSMLFVSMPNFWVAFLLILVFSVQLRWLPAFGFNSPQSLILPAVALALPNLASLSRLTRSTLRELRYKDFVRTARSKGNSERRVWLRHTLPNAAVVLVTLIGNQFAVLIATTVVIETIFSWPGVGHFYITHAIAARDIPVIQGSVLLFALFLVVTNLIVDLSYGFLDPRIRVS
jgi:peptide/nickel transport system permease protein